MKQYSFFLCISLFLIATGCGPNYIFDQQIPIADQKWSYQDTLDFDVSIEDTLKTYNLQLDIEHAADFPYQNLYVMIHTRFPSGSRISEQLSIDLTDKSGRPLGACNAEWCTVPINLQEGAYFNALGQHLITIEQFMRLDPLPGIKSLSLKIEDTGILR